MIRRVNRARRRIAMYGLLVALGPLVLAAFTGGHVYLYLAGSVSIIATVLYLAWREVVK